MTNRRPPTSDQFLVAWFEDGPTAMPDRVIDVVADRIGRQSQRHSWRLPWRLPLNTQLKLAAGLAAILVLAVAGYSLLPRLGIGGPGPTPTAVPTPTAAAAAKPAPTVAAVACEGGTSGCLGTLSGGTYTAANFRPRLSYTVPAGPVGGPPTAFWANTYDPGRAYTLVPPGGGYSFQVVSEVEIPEQTQPECNAVRKAGVGSSVADWVEFLTTNPGIAADAPVPVTVGGADGFKVHFGRAASWTGTCPGSLGPAVVVWVRTGVTSQGRWMDDQQETFFILDVGGSTVLLTLESSPDPAQHAADLANAQPIIDSFRFTPAT